MKGLELSRAYYEEYGKPMIDTQLAQYKPYLAAGLVGEGSECLGFDDELSTDHDFGPAFCLWVPEELYAKAGTEMQRAYDSLPASLQRLYEDHICTGRRPDRSSSAGRILS